MTSLARPRSRVSISRSNEKTGTASVSLPPGVTCVPDIPCFTPDGCYAWKMYFGTHYKYRNVGQAWDRNWRIYQDDPDFYFQEIRHFLTRLTRKEREKRYFRWHVGGDCPDEDYVLRLLDLCAETPHISHTIFTKRYAWFTAHHRLVPENLSVYVSGWPGIDLPEDTRRLFRQFWLIDPDHPDPRIPDEALECPGSCPECRMCWRNQAIVKCHKH